MPNSPALWVSIFVTGLWIAEMNSHINIMRIFDDYIAELHQKKNEPTVKNGIEIFSNNHQPEKGIDELRHEMHLAKMTLASFKTK